MKLRDLGKTGLQVSEIGLGAWQIGGALRGYLDRLGWFSHGWGHIDEKDAVDLVKQCGDMGINFIDTAAGYGAGRSEEVVGKAVKGERDRWIVETKGGEGWTDENVNWKEFSRERLLRQIDESLARLQMDYVDVYLLHSPSLDEVADGEAFEALRKIKESGKARFVGASVGASGDVGKRLIREGLADVLQVPISITDPTAATALFPAAAEAGVGIVARGAFGAGFFVGTIDETTEFADDDRRKWQSEKSKASRAKVAEQYAFLAGPERTLAQSYLKYLLSFDAVSTVITGSKNAAHMGENAKASAAPDLTEAELRRIEQIQAG